MPRSKFNFSSKSKKSNKVAPVPVNNNSPSLGQSLAGNVVAGMGVGVGHGIGNAMVGSIISSKSEKQVVPDNMVQHNEPSIACKILFNEYKQCLKRQEIDKYVDCSYFMKKAMENNCN